MAHGRPDGQRRPAPCPDLPALRCRQRRAGRPQRKRPPRGVASDC
ncbi:hypothetical protein RC1_0982 [Rhodospirillum centenum SW]|uniref:Uncharacterized protein n=1 Tax=Rhodospirillum centenum (strain ATCC 51521 / SW) TaxID=414684 RepID=B6ISH0_RHOCS|nr:hypothetical protein RC1_0982 [Rhodospirillum centenum SW]